MLGPPVSLRALTPPSPHRSPRGSVPRGCAAAFPWRALVFNPAPGKGERGKEGLDGGLDGDYCRRKRTLNRALSKEKVPTNAGRGLAQWPPVCWPPLLMAPCGGRAPRSRTEVLLRRPPAASLRRSAVAVALPTTATSASKMGRSRRKPNCERACGAPWWARFAGGYQGRDSGLGKRAGKQHRRQKGGDSSARTPTRRAMLAGALHAAARASPCALSGKYPIPSPPNAAGVTLQKECSQLLARKFALRAAARQLRN